jgi:hypothetical protein
LKKLGVLLCFRRSVNSKRRALCEFYYKHRAYFNADFYSSMRSKTKKKGMDVSHIILSVNERIFTIFPSIMQIFLSKRSLRQVSTILLRSKPVYTQLQLVNLFANLRTNAKLMRKRLSARKGSARMTRTERDKITIQSLLLLEMPRFKNSRRLSQSVGAVSLFFRTPKSVKPSWKTLSRLGRLGKMPNHL